MDAEEKKDSIFSIFNKSSQPGPRPAPEVRVRPDDGRTAALEAAVKELKAEMAALAEAAARKKAEPPPPPPPPPFCAPLDDLKGELAAASEGVKRATAAEAGLAVRMERSENLIAELKILVASQQAQLDKYSGQKLVADGLGEYLRDMVARLNTRLVEAENMMHLSLADMSSRLTGSEAVYGKMFSGAEEQVKKDVAGQIAALDAHLKKLRESVVWLADEYKIVMERKIRALEGKYSAFEAISTRMDTIDAALKMGGKMGLL